MKPFAAPYSVCPAEAGTKPASFHRRQEAVTEFRYRRHHHLQEIGVDLPRLGQVAAGHAVTGVIDQMRNAQPARLDRGLQRRRCGRVGQIRGDGRHRHPLAQTLG
jgi:hypothetical protein